MLIIDWLHVPLDLRAGEYVLGWRWDSEETAQVWTHCADVTIAGAHTLARGAADVLPDGHKGRLTTLREHAPRKRGVGGKMSAQ